MVKEFLLICFIALMAGCLLKIIIKGKSGRALYISLGIMIIGIIINLGYNLYRLFPETWLNTVGGDYRYGTFHGNMLAWSDGFMYGEEILIPMVRNRRVELDGQAGYCRKFFEIYGEGVDTLDLSSEEREKIIAKIKNCDNLYQCEFEALALMGYTWDENMPEDLIEEFDNHKYPLIHIDMDSIKGSDKLKIVLGNDHSLYMTGC